MASPLQSMSVEFGYQRGQLRDTVVQSDVEEEMSVRQDSMIGTCSITFGHCGLDALHQWLRRNSSISMGHDHLNSRSSVLCAQGWSCCLSVQALSALCGSHSQKTHTYFPLSPCADNSLILFCTHASVHVTTKPLPSKHLHYSRYRFTYWGLRSEHTKRLLLGSFHGDTDSWSFLFPVILFPLILFPSHFSVTGKYFSVLFLPFARKTGKCPTLLLRYFINTMSMCV